MLLRDITCYSYSLALRRPVSLAGQIVRHREGALVAMVTDDEAIAWGEVSPLPGFSFRSLDEVVQRAYWLAGILKGVEPADALKQITPLVAADPSLYVAFQNALESLVLTEVPRGTVPLCALLDGDAPFLEERLFQALEAGYKTLKLKVGSSDFEGDCALTEKLLNELPPGCSLRLDANRAWAYDEAAYFCGLLKGRPVEFLEEPLKDWRALPRLQEETGIPCAVDETLQALGRLFVSTQAGMDNALRCPYVSVIESVGAIVWKPTLSFHPELLGILSDAPIILSGSYESGVGTAVVLAQAAQPGGNGLAAGVDTYTRLAEDVLEHSLPLDTAAADLEQMDSLGRQVDRNRLRLLWHV